MYFISNKNGLNVKFRYVRLNSIPLLSFIYLFVNYLAVARHFPAPITARAVVRYFSMMLNVLAKRVPFFSVIIVELEITTVGMVKTRE